MDGTNVIEEKKQITIDDIYLNVISNLTDNLPEVRFGPKYIEDILTINFSISGINITAKELYTIITKQYPFLCKFRKRKVYLEELIDLLRKTKQNEQAEIYNNYLLFNEHFEKKKEDTFVIQELNLFFHKTFIEEYKNISLETRQLIKSTQYAFFKFYTYYAKQKECDLQMFDPTLPENINRPFPKENDIPREEPNFVKTIMFINLYSILTNIKKKHSDIFEIIVKQIKIDPYLRYFMKSFKQVLNIYDSITHFRDSVCHLEYEDNKIKNSFARGNKFSFISNYAINPTFQLGDGQLNIKNHIEPLIKLLSQMYANKLEIYEGINKDNKVVLADVIYSLGYLTVNRSADLNIIKNEDSYNITIKCKH